MITSLHTEAINHDPAMTMLQTGHEIAGRPPLGAWVSYGLGDENANLPAFVVMISRPTGPTNAQPLHERMWGAGFLPTKHQGVRFSPGRDPVLYLSNPPGVTRERRREFLDTLGGLNRMTFDAFHDPETAARIDQFEMAFRMQAAVPEPADLSTEPASTFEKYGPESKKPGMTYGETDDYSYNIVKNPVHIHDLNATTLHLLGIDHTKLTYRFAGRDYRLTDVHGTVVKDVLA